MWPSVGPGLMAAHMDPYTSEEEMVHLNQEHREEMLKRAAASGFKSPWSPPQRSLTGANQGFVQEVYGGQISGELEELKVVKAWRPGPMGQMELGTGVIHRVHYEDHSVTVQFIPDQHRARLPFASVKLMEDITPQYPTIRLKQGDKLPSAEEMGPKGYEGVGQDGPTQSHMAQRWGIPAPTLDALRNRSVPASKITGVYGEHFYSNLYRNNFYKGEAKKVSSSGHIGVDDDGQHGLSMHAAGKGGGKGGFGAGFGAGLGGAGAGAGAGCGMGPGFNACGAGAGGLGAGGAGAASMGPGCMGLGGVGPGGMGPGGMGPQGMASAGFGPGGFPGGADAVNQADGGIPVGWVGTRGAGPGLGYDVGANGVLSGAPSAHDKEQLFDPSRGNAAIPGGGKVISHHYIPLEGAELEQDLVTGRWYPMS